MDERLQVYESKMTKSFDALGRDLAAIRAGRANPHVLDKFKVDYYGTPTPLQQVGNISVPEARIIQIQPWEKKMIKEIEKAIMTSELGINPTNYGASIRLVLPELTEERRKELVKDVKKKGEAAKVAVRNIRRDANDAYKKLAKQDVSEDEIKELEKLGYTVKYKFYRSTKKSSGYKATVTKNVPLYINTAGRDGVMYYYKANIMIYDKDGELIAQTAIKQCKYANRRWSK